jgi:hypothetical protein
LKLNRHRALDLWWSMIFLQNRYPPIGSSPRACFSGSCSSWLLCAERFPNFRRAFEQPRRLFRHRTVRTSKPAGRTQMQLRSRDFPGVRLEWVRKVRLRPCVESSATRSADCRCHIGWPDALIRQLPKAHRGRGFQRSKELPQTQVLVAPDPSNRNEAASRNHRQGAERVLRGSLLPLRRCCLIGL